MLEQLPLLLATPIATVILNKFYEGVGSELAKKAITQLPPALQKKVQELGQLVWDKCLRGKSGADKLLQAAANDSAANSEIAQKRLTDYLNKVLESDTSLEQQVQEQADKIRLELTQIEDNSSQVQVNYGGNNSQNRINGGNVYQGTITINQGNPN